VQTWCHPGLGGGSQGGSATACSIRAARILVEDLVAERLPHLLADFPTVDLVAAALIGPVAQP
jgi:hypothetical protein